MNRYEAKGMPPLHYKNAEPITTKYGLVYMRMLDSASQRIDYVIFRRPHTEIGYLTYDFSDDTWSAWQAIRGGDGNLFVLVNEDDLTRDDAIMALQKKDPINWGKDAEGNTVRFYLGR